jgi:hypothetical protein
MQLARLQNAESGLIPKHADPEYRQEWQKTCATVLDWTVYQLKQTGGAIAWYFLFLLTLELSGQQNQEHKNNIELTKDFYLPSKLSNAQGDWTGSSQIPFK